MWNIQLVIACVCLQSKWMQGETVQHVFESHLLIYMILFSFNSRRIFCFHNYSWYSWFPQITVLQFEFLGFPSLTKYLIFHCLCSSFWFFLHYNLNFWCLIFPELLRRTADHILVEMVQLLFMRLPEFKEDSKWAKNMRKVK